MTISKSFIGLDIRFGTVSPPTHLVREPGAQYFVTSDGTSGGTITEQWLYNKNGWAQIPTATGTVDPAQVMQAVGSVTQDITGFVDRTSSDYSWNNSTRTFTLSPTGSSYLVYKRGVAYTVTASLTITIANTTGGRYIRFNTTSQQLEDVGVGVYPNIKEDVLVAYIYWDGTKALIVGDERHSVARDTQWHYSQHMDVGAIWRSGGTLSYTLDDISANTLSIADVRLADEDIEHLITHSASPTTHYQQVLDGQAVLPVIYVVGQTFVQTAASTSPWVSVSGAYQYNNITNGVGSLQPVNNSKFINYWLIATNDSQYPIKLLMGQKQHGTVAEAELEKFESYDLPMPEFAEMYRITGQVNGGFKLVAVSVISGRQNVAIEAVSATSHANLTGRSTVDSHPISAITGLQTELNKILQNVSLTTLSSPQVLSWNGTNWINKTLSTSDISNVATTTPVNGQTLVWSSTTSKWTPTTVTNALSTLSDTNVVSPGTGQALIWNGTKWANQALPSGVTLLSALSDAAITSPTSGQFLVWNGTKWANTTKTIPTNLSSLTGDTTITSPTSGQFLKYDGAKWVNSTVSVPTNLDSLTDVAITSAASGQVLSYNGTSWVNSDISIPKDTTVVTSSGSSGVNFDYSTTNLFYFTPTGSITTLNITNMPPAASSTMSSAVTIVVKQGATAYLPASYQINGSAVTVKWFNGTAPTGSINAHDVITLNVLRDGSNFIVLGQLVVFK